MKIRTDFVTNSSSSSFIVSHNNHFTEEQRNRLADFALKNFLGDVTCSTEEKLVEYFNNTYGCFYSVGMFSAKKSNLKKFKIAFTGSTNIINTPSSLRGKRSSEIFPHLISTSRIILKTS